MSNVLEFDPVPHEYKLDGEVIPSVSQIIDRAGLYGKGKAFFKREHAERGTRVHLATELHDLGTLDMASVAGTKLEGYLVAWQKFLSDTGSEILEIEKRAWAEVDGMKYAMTVDRVLRLPDGRVFVCDLKSGSKAAKPHGAQVAGYAIGMEQALGLEIDAQMCVYVGPKGKYKVGLYEEPEWGELWMRCLNGFYGRAAA